jgi:hypothetical protein
MVVLAKKTVEDHAYFLMRKAQIEAMNTERLGMFHVSDVIKDCMRYPAYSKIRPRMMSTEDYKSLYMGQVIHSNSMVADPDKHELFLAYDFEENISITYDEACKIPEDDPRQLNILYGSVDDVIEVDGQYVITDKKTTGSLDYFVKKRDKKPNDTHMKQINVYRSLLEKCYGIEAKYGCVIYLPNSISKEERDKVHPMYFKLEDIEKTDVWVKEKLAILQDFKITGNLPDRTRNYLCDGFCPYALECFGTYGDKE